MTPQEKEYLAEIEAAEGYLRQIYTDKEKDRFTFNEDEWRVVQYAYYVYVAWEEFGKFKHDVVRARKEYSTALNYIKKLYKVANLKGQLPFETMPKIIDSVLVWEIDRGPSPEKAVSNRKHYLEAIDRIQKLYKDAGLKDGNINFEAIDKAIDSVCLTKTESRNQNLSYVKKILSSQFKTSKVKSIIRDFKAALDTK